VTASTPRHLPTERELLLLRAACFGGEAAASAWSRWRAQADLDAAGKPELDLMPAVYRNLGEAGVMDERALAIFRGAYRKAWIQNRLNLEGAARAAKLLASRGIESLLLKGAALVACVYGDAGVRPMADVDLLVPLDRAEAAYGLLLANGWRPDIPPYGEMARVVQVVRSLDLVHESGTRLDLHWHVLADCCDAGDDADFWAAAREVSLNDQPVRTLCTTDLLLHAITHGSKWSSSRSILWLLDAYRLIEAGAPGVDWERLVEQALQRQVSLALLSGLRYLRDNLAVEVPGWVLARLLNARAGLVERLDYRCQDSADDLSGVARREIFDYLQRTRRRSVPDRLRGGVWYLGVAWGLPPWRLPAEAARRLYAHVRPRSAGRRQPPAGQAAD
jgi:hypothetical protein